MRIAICNKNYEELKIIKYALYRYANFARLDIVVDCYLYGEQMLKSAGAYPVVFLSQTLSGKSGLNVWRELITFNPLATVIFTDRSADIAIKAIELKPFRFLKSPISEEAVFSAVDELFKEKFYTLPVLIKNNCETFCLKPAEILFIEADNKHCNVHLDHNTLRFNKTMSHIVEILPQSHFSKVNRSFVVNLNHILKYSHDCVFLTNGQEIPLSKNYAKDFKQQYSSLCNPYN